MQRIVVGVDGSPPSVEALRWAVAEAAAHGAEVVAVAAWEFPFVPSGPGAGFYVGPTADDLTEDAVHQLDEALGQLDTGSVTVTRLTEYGSPAHVLLEQSAGADLLVVGARGHGGFTGLLLGSVSQQCATHAVCPTVVVPYRPQR
jgi:nucleotide-binding universal stress UspA family protein